ncbi:MAG: glucan endo-1,3-beta-D-glucosidase [Flavobacteriaceae bacterium]|jgi:hypothetical protein|nr:glucan endo-1,3-beta-D-glucosidase [Flavobacteriaceae bacterium]
MKKINLLFKTIFALAVFTFISCEEEEFTLGDITAPSNVTLTAEIVGASAEAPNGDGSGTVHFTVTGTGAITYKFLYNGEEKLTPSGKKTYSFSTVGTHDYTVSAIAVGPGGTSTVVAKTVTVLATYSPPAELVAALVTGKWRVYKEVGAHMGVGPADSANPDWWAANPNDKASTGMYDDRYTFAADGTFTFDVGADGQIFGKADPMDADLGGPKGQVKNGDNEYTNFPFESFTGKWSISAPGGVETINLTGLGFMGFYVGSHDYTILDRSKSDELRLRTKGSGGLGWFWKITNKE